MDGSSQDPHRLIRLALVAVTAVAAFAFLLLTASSGGALAGEEDGPKYVGSRKCKKCHLKPYKTFLKYNKMATALERLKPEEYLKKDDITDSGKYCIECHVVGFGKPGGFSLPKDQAAVEKLLADKKKRKRLFESVGHAGCEVCHGPGETHAKMKIDAIKELLKAGKDCGIQRRSDNACMQCHNPHVSHVRGKEVKGTWTVDRGPSTASFEGATYIGAEACKSCHVKQHGTWAATLHSTAFTVLKPEEYDKLDDALDPALRLKRPPEKKKCIQCHVTGYGKPGGFKSLDDEHSKQLLGVQCEACHGPGSLHRKMAEEYAKAKKELKGVKDQKLNRVPQNVCRECHHAHISHKLKYPGRRK